MPKPIGELQNGEEEKKNQIPHMEPQWSIKKDLT